MLYLPRYDVSQNDHVLYQWSQTEGGKLSRLRVLISSFNWTLDKIRKLVHIFLKLLLASSMIGHIISYNIVFFGG